MARVPTFTLYERVTSDSSTGPGLVRPLVMSGKGPSRRRARRPRSRDADGPARESVTAPNHSVTRSFVYPEP